MTDQLLSSLMANPILLAPFGILAALGLLAALLPKRAGKTRLNVSDPKVQLGCVKKVTFQTTPLLNRSEAKVHAAIVDALQDADPTLTLMAQTSLGEILRPATGSRAEKDNAFRSINSKRLDFSVFGPDQHLRLGIEYHGSGHYKGNARNWDAVKRAVFQRANLPLIELPAAATPAEINAQVLAALSPDDLGAAR